MRDPEKYTRHRPEQEDGSIPFRWSWIIAIGAIILTILCVPTTITAP